MEIKIEKYELVDWKELKPFQPSDLKKQTKTQLNKIKQSFKMNGVKSPFLVWQDKKDVWVLDGHTRIPALKLLEDEGVSIPEKLPAVFIKCKDKREAKKAILIYNSHYADIKQDALFDFIEDLNFDEIKNEIHIPQINFNEFDSIEKDIDADAQIDIAAELVEKWGVNSGQVWKLGEHKILCGDSANKNSLGQLLGADRPCLVFTDPPYGVSIGDKNLFLNSFQPFGRNLKTIKDDNITPDALKRALLPAFKNLKEHCSEDATFFVTAPQNGELGMMMMMMMKEAGLPIRHVLMWYKNAPTFSMGRLDYDYQHEPILLTWGKRHKSIMGGQFKTSVWKVDRPRANKEHPTMKPVELYENALLNNSEKGDIAIDIYSGSGTMIIACERTGRKARCLEIDPGYVAVTIQRWVDATGGTPEII